MNFGPLIFLGLFVTMAISWCGLILTPQRQLGRQSPALIEETGQLYPSDRPGAAHQGQEVYRANGCYYCHTRQVTGNDVGRWGSRITVAQDFLYDDPVMLGRQRVGPDLANIAARNPDIRWHLLHLYNPQITSKGSTMPGYRFLFQQRAMSGGQVSTEALPLTGKDAPPAGFEIIPKAEAYQLVHYLLSQRFDIGLLEAPMPQAKKRSGTNAPPAATASTNNAATNSAQPAPANPPAK